MDTKFPAGVYIGSESSRHIRDAIKGESVHDMPYLANIILYLLFSINAYCTFYLFI